MMRPREVDVLSLPSKEAMLKAICEKENITESEARERVEEYYKSKRMCNLQAAAYCYCLSCGIKDEEMFKYEEAAPFRVAQISGELVNILRQFVRINLWDRRYWANEYCKEVIVLLLGIFGASEEFTSSQILALLQVIEKATHLGLSDGDVEWCLDILDKNKIKRLPSLRDKAG